ncbi:hypothetical protein FVR03_01340 [Pontibacter qinzhouensis]|uniref:Uncharacterized protein n=1 Tax=Pontibacter qinzhouensis TaxID=2603253 RepID=A0A5C8KD85_9BACT|nr:hypothetical protein [Pontibacter qinzhouensis]TXK52388.1 hypothetical protein FVR03_01340 [Pontibacter qinzhouensis]
MIKADFNLSAVRKYIAEQVREYELHVIQAFTDAGNAWQERAKLKTKSQGSFGNITFNLRSSIGYILLKDGVELAESFEVVGTGDAGAEKGLAYARELAGNYPAGIVLICVAGMEYAAAVESKGYDVITGSSLYMEQDLAELLAA